MNKHKILVVDDRLNIRESVYRSVLIEEFFELHFVGTLSELSSLKNEYFDCFIIDMVLDLEDWNIELPYVIEDFINELPGRSPIILISSNWDQSSLLGPLKVIIDNNPNQLIKFFAWSEFLKESTQEEPQVHNAISTEIKQLLHVWHRRANFKLEDSEPFRALLIADLQYGDKLTSKQAATVESDIYAALLQEGAIPDIIILAGDIAFSGSESEYMEVLEKLENDLLKPLWGENSLEENRERIILVPGNHDVNLRISSLEKYDFDFSNNALKDKERRTISSSYESFKMSPFRNFAYKLTKDTRWLLQESMDWIDRRFEHYGIRFFNLSTASKIDASHPKRAMLDIDSLNKLTRESVALSSSEGLCNVVISHHCIMSNQNEQDIENWETAQAFFKRNKVNLWLCGHYHRFHKHQVYEKENNYPSLNVIKAPTSHIMTGDHQRGFVLLSFKRTKHKVSNVSCKLFKFDNGDIVPKEVDVELD